MTDLLYLDDAYLRSFAGTVVDVRENQVALDRTAFYPTGGGQPHDTGVLGGLPVTGVRKEGDLVWHAVELWPEVTDAVAALPAGERDALILFVWEDLGYDEIAAALDIPVGTVRSRLNRARTRMRELRPPTGRETVTESKRGKIE